MKAIFQKVIFTILLLPLCFGAAVNATSSEPLIAGHMLSWTVYGEKYHVSDIPAERLTHLIYGYANINDRGEVVHGDLFADVRNSYPGDNPTSKTYRGNFRQMQLLKKKQSDLKLILSVGGWKWSERFSDAALTEESRRRFTKSLIKYIKKYHFDGVEIDWEYPMRGGEAGNIERPEDGENFVLLLSEIRQQLKQLEVEEKKEFELFAVLSTIPKTLEGLDLKRVSEQVDYLSLLTYNYYGFWGLETAHQAPLHGVLLNNGESSSDISKYVRRLIDLGIPPGKILFSISPLATSWAGVPDKNNGRFQQAERIPAGAYDENDDKTGTYGYSHILKMLEDPSYHLYWDDQAKASYLYNRNEEGGHFVSFESRRSLDLKLDFVQDMKLGGVIFRYMYADGLGKDSMIRTTQKRFFPIRTFQIEGGELLLEYWFISFGAPPLLLVFASILIARIRRNRFLLVEEKEYIEDRQEFELMKKNLHGIETPLSGLISLTDDLEFHNKGPKNAERNRELIQLGEKGKQLSMVVHTILNNTTIDQIPAGAELQSLDPELILRQVIEISMPKQRQKAITFNWQVDPSLPSINANEVLLQKVLRCGVNLVLNSAKHSGKIALSLMEEKDEIALSIIDPDPAIPITAQHFPDLEQLQRLTEQQGGNFCVIPSGQSQQFRFSFPKSGKLPGNTKGKLIIKQPEKRELPEKESSDSVPVAVRRSMALQEFTEQLGEFKDVENLLKILFDFFINDDQSDRVTLLQEGKVIKQSDPELTAEHAESMEKAYAELDEEKALQVVGEEKNLVFATPQGIGGYTFAIESHEPLSREDLDYFNSLLAQATMVRKHLYGLVKKPQLLAELYEIASRRSTLLFIKAEKGYSGIYDKGVKKPLIICSRLRKLKLYFDDQSLIQVHRSYLVNPSKVTEVKKVGKSRYEILLEKNKIPVSRIYLDRLKKQRPDWF